MNYQLKTWKVERMVRLWHPTKNGEEDPLNIAASSKKPKWWKCSVGHEWDASPMVITMKEDFNTCPICAGRRILLGFNDLSTTNPFMASMWNHSKNTQLTPQTVTEGSAKKAWWMDKCGHEWESQIVEMCRIDRKSYCPFCAGNRVLAGFNDLETVNPKLAELWHPSLNEKTVSETHPGSKAKVWWLGKCGHDWEAPTSKMAISLESKSQGCPYCYGKMVLVGFNDFASQKPDMVQYWHVPKNGSLTPDSVTVSSGKKVWWVCAKGHQWEKSVSEVSRRETVICPQCKEAKQTAKPQSSLPLEKKVLPKDYLSNEILQSEWHPTKNLPYIFENHPIGTRFNAWWICPKWHEWQSPTSRRLKGNKSESFLSCSVCRGRSFRSGVNDMGTTHPEMAAEWHPTKNGDITPADVQAGSNSQAWWKCKLGHEWRVSPNSRARQIHKNGKISSCPTCSGDIILTGFNDFATKNPELLKEWHPTKNTDVDPTKIHEWSSAKVWWKCEKNGHEWEAMLYSRRDGRGCSKCNLYHSKIEKRLFESLTPHFPDAVHGIHLPVKWHHYSNSSNVDIFIPSMNAVIEYDGSWYHALKKDNDTKKTEALLNAGYNVLRIREDNLFFLDIKGCVELRHYPKKDDIDALAADVARILLTMVIDVDAPMGVSSK